MSVWSDGSMWEGDYPEFEMALRRCQRRLALPERQRAHIF
jgi:hypothetical protein